MAAAPQRYRCEIPDILVTMTGETMAPYASLIGFRAIESFETAGIVVFNKPLFSCVSYYQNWREKNVHFEAQRQVALWLHLQK